MSLILAVILGASAGRPTLAILPPTPGASQADASWVGLAIADDLNTRLLSHRQFDPKTLKRNYPLDVFGWRQAQSAARAEGIDISGVVGSKGLTALRRQLGSEYLFSGTYRISGNSVVLRWSLSAKRPSKIKELNVPLANLAVGTEKIYGDILKHIDPESSARGHALRSLPLAAMRSYGRALQITGGQSLDPRAHIVVGDDKLHSAHSFLNGATDAAPGFARAWVERSIVSAMLGEFERAEGELVQALAQSAEFDPPSALGMWYLYARQGKEVESLESLKEATTTHPGFLQGLGYLGVGYARTSRTHESLGVFTQYRARVPASPWARVMRARALAGIGKHDLAISETRAVLKEFPGSVMVLTALASRFIDAKRLSLARKTLERALVRHPEHPALLTRLSYVELEENRPEAALKLAEHAVTKLGDGRGESLAGYAHLNFAHALARLKRNKQAYAMLKKAVALGISVEDRLMIRRDPALRDFLKDPRSALTATDVHHDHHH